MKTPIIHSMLAAIALAIAGASPALAQDYPAKPVRVVSTFPVGSGPDVALRLVADRLSQKWGQPVMVENKPGGNGFIAIDAAKRSSADGYTLLQMDNAQTSAHPYLFKKLPYDLMRDFEPITPMLRNYFFVVVSVDSPLRSTGDLLQAARANAPSLARSPTVRGSSAVPDTSAAPCWNRERAWK